METCKPQITYFKRKAPRHTNFATGQLTQSLGGGGNAPLIGAGRNSPRGVQTCFQRSSDLIGPTYIRTVLPALNIKEYLGTTAPDMTAAGAMLDPSRVGSSSRYTDLNAGDGLRYVDEVGLYLVHRAEIQIGAHRMDEVYNWNQYFEWHARKTDENLMQVSLGIGSEQELIDRAYHQQVMYTPINFWYTRSPSEYLPAISCQAHEIVFKMDGVASDDMWGGVGTFAQLGAVTNGSALPVTSIDAINNAIATESTQEMVYDGVYLDRAERMMFAKMGPGVPD